VDRLRLNGKEHRHNWISHDALLGGAVLDFSMSASPNKQRGTADADAPYSFSTVK
jgi:putative alpha-1,2-mannosidase